MRLMLVLHAMQRDVREGAWLVATLVVGHKVVSWRAGCDCKVRRVQRGEEASVASKQGPGWGDDE